MNPPHFAKPLKGLVAFLTMDSLGDFIAYDHLTYEPLRRLGWLVEEVPWRKASVDWNRFRAVIIRTPWDYHLDVDEFLRVLEVIDRSRAELLNPLDIIRWNVDKQYLRQLQEQSVPTVPTVWIQSPSHHDVDNALRELRSFASNESEPFELVLKPCIGAGALDTFRLRHDQRSSWEGFLQRYENRVGMLQPFLPSVVAKGEWSLFFFNGTYSHCVLKTPKAGDFRVQEEYGSRLMAVTPTADQLAVAQAALNAIPQTLLYARVDLVELPDQSPAVIELELIEPSLYFPYCDESPARFSQAVDTLLAPIHQSQ